MSFRRYGGVTYNAKNNFVKSNYNTAANLSVTGNVGQDNSYINFLSDISGDIIIYGNVDISGNLDVSGNANIFGNLDVSGNENLSGDLHVYSNALIDGNLDVSGNENLSGDLHVYGNENLYGNLLVYRNEILSGDLVVNGSENLIGDLFVNGTSHLRGMVYEPSGVTGSTASYDSIFISGESVFNGQVSAPSGVTGATGSFSNIYVSGQSVLNGQVSAPSGITGATGSFDNVFVYHDMDVCGNLYGSYMYLTATDQNYGIYPPNSVVPKSYVDTIGSGLKPGGSVVCATTASIGAGDVVPSGIPPTTSTDGYKVQDGDNVLVICQNAGNNGNLPAPAPSSAVNNGAWIVNAGGPWSRPSSGTFSTGTDAAGAFCLVLNGNTYDNDALVQINKPAIVGTNKLQFTILYQVKFQIGQGLNIKSNTLSVDPSLNFINYLDSTSGVPNASGTLTIGSYSNKTIIGPTGPTSYPIVMQSGVTGPAASFTNGYFTNMNVSGPVTFNGRINAPGGITGATGSFNNIILGPTGAFIQFPDGTKQTTASSFTGNTGSFTNLYVSGTSKQIGLISAPGGITGATGSFTSVQVNGNSGCLLKLVNNTFGYEGGQSNIEFWNKNDPNNFYRLGKISAIDIAGVTGASYQSALALSASYHINDFVEGMRIVAKSESTAYVGIGTSNPDYTLDVSSNNTNGVLQIANNYGIQNIVGSSSTLFTTKSIVLDASGNTANTPQIKLYNYRYAAGTTWIGVSTRLQSIMDDSVNQAYIEFNNPAYSIGMYAKSGSNSGGITINSSFCVGIQNTNPQYILDVNGCTRCLDNSTGQNTIALRIENSTNMNSPYYNGMFFVPYLSNDGYNGISKNGDVGMFFDTGNGNATGTGGLVIAPWTTSTSGLRMDSSGNVGIGTNSPTAPLSVFPSSSTKPEENGIYVYNNRKTATSHSIITVRTGSDNTQPSGNPYISYDVFHVAGWSTGIDNADSQKFKISNQWDSISTNTRLTITTGGNVGIGKTNPQYTLDVSGNINFTGNLYKNGSVFGGTSQWTTNGNNIYYDSGNVGIGTISPTAPLSVYPSSSTKPEENGIYVYNNRQTATSHSIITVRTGSDKTQPSGNPYISYDVFGLTGWSTGIDNADSQKFKISNQWDSISTNTRLTITTDGNVGIGTISPTTKLQVDGTITATTFSGNLSGNATTATTATNATTATTATNATITTDRFSTNAYPVFVTSSGQKALSINDTTAALTYIPSTGNLTATSFSSGSDYRLKSNVQPLLPSRTIDDLKPVEYDLSGNKHDMGFIAHEVQETLPFLVHGEKDGANMQSLNYNGFIALLVKEVQELKKKNTILEERLDRLEKMINK